MGKTDFFVELPGPLKEVLGVTGIHAYRPVCQNQF